jgi:hypothetical protein
MELINFIIDPQNVLFIANFVIFISLIPSILSSQKPHQTTSALNIIISAFFIYSFVQLNYYFVVLINVLIAIEWTILFFQKLRYGSLSEKRKREILVRIINSVPTEKVGTLLPQFIEN